MKSVFSALVYKDIRESFRTGRISGSEVFATASSLLLTAVSVVMSCLVVNSLAELYINLEINGTADTVARASELLSFVYALVFVGGVFTGAREVTRAFFGSGEAEMLLTMPVRKDVVLLSKAFGLYLKLLLYFLLIIVPVNITVASQFAEGAVYWGATVVLVFLLPLISLGGGCLLAFPGYFVLRFLHSKPLAFFLCATLLLLGLFGVYWVLLKGLAELLATGEIKFFFNAETVREISRVTDKLFPSCLFADMLVGDDAGKAVGLALLFSAGLTAAGLLCARALMTPAARTGLVSARSVRTRRKTLYPFKSPTVALFFKEWVTVFRTPAYAVRFLSAAVLLPFAVWFCTDVLTKALKLMVFVDCGFETAVFFVCTFASLANTFSSSNVSRDGDFAQTLRTMPVTYERLVAVKIVFCFGISALSVIAGTGVLAGVCGLSAGQSFFVLFAGLIFSAAQICLSTALDVLRPVKNRRGTEACENKPVLAVSVFTAAAVSAITGVIALSCGVLLTISKGEKIADAVFCASQAALGAFYLAASLLVLFLRAKKKAASAAEVL